MSFLKPFIAIFLSIPAFIAGILSPATLNPPAPTLGAGVVQAQSFTLAGSGVTSNATTITLKTFKLPDASTTIQITDFQSSVGYATVEPGVPREEQISFSGVTQNGDGTATLSGVTRGLDFRGANCSAVTANQKAHAGGTVLILSNTACYYSQFPAKSESTTITGTWGFSTAPIINTAGTNASSAATYGQLASTSFSGTVNAATTQKGIVQEATRAQMASGTAVGNTGADLVTPNNFFSSVATTSQVSVVNNNSGTIATGFVGQSANDTYNFLGPVTLASTTLSASTTVTGTATFTASSTLVFRGTTQGLGGKMLTATSTQLDIRNTATPQTLLSVVIPSSTLGANGALQVQIPFTLWGFANSLASTTINISYGGSNISTSTIIGAASGAGSSGSGMINASVIANNSTTSEFGYVIFNGMLSSQLLTSATSSAQTISVNSANSQTLTITATNGASSPSTGFVTLGYMVSTLGN